MKRTPLLVAFMFALTACDNERTATPPASASDSTVVDSAMVLVTRAAAVTLGAREFPARADSVLAASGLTIEQYEALLYRIAADSSLAALYRDAIGGKS